MKVRHPMFIHYVRDMARARHFYKTVFDVQSSFESPGWSTLDFGVVELALHILSPEDVEAPIPHAGVNFEIGGSFAIDGSKDSIEDMQGVIESCGGQLRELREPDNFVPVRVASFVDCEGNGFELRQAV